MNGLTSQVVLDQVESGLQEFRIPAAAAALRAQLLAEAQPVTLEWDYSEPDEVCQVWIVALLSNGVRIGYSVEGFGPEHPWGILPPERQHVGSNDYWFSYLEDAFFQSGNWDGPKPRGYMIR